jgi:hypothetical protein
VPKAEVNTSVPKPSEPIALPLARPLVEFRYPLCARATTPTYRVSLGQFNEFISLAGVPKAASPSPSETHNQDSGLAIRQLALSPLVPSQLHLGLGLLTCVLKEFLNNKDASFRSAKQQGAFYLMIK